MKRLKVLAYYTGSEGTYVSVMPTARSVRVLEQLRELLVPYNFSTLHPALNWHVTVIYSEQNIDGVDTLHDTFNLASDRNFEAHIIEADYWPGHKKTGNIVVKLNSDELKELHYGLRDLGLDVNFPDYEAHITLVEHALEDHTEDECKEAVAMLNRKIITHMQGRQLVLTGIKLEDVS